MKVLNKKTIRRLSFRSLKASGKRNIIAAAAIALTTVLFTTLFTIAMSLNSSYETFTFRQIGGYAHGSFKDVDDSQIKEIASHDKVKAVGERDVIGTISDGVFAKVPAEISFMDKNCSKWSYIEMSEGREPKERDEIAMDTKALEILGIKPEVGAEVSITYEISDKEQNLGKRTDSFKLSGWWE
ncbi:MAG: ABC transporter permease, partial [Lentihominibacter sp.]